MSISDIAIANTVDRWQWHDHIFTNYSVEHGLPHGAIYSLTEDSLGFIWLVTTKGLVRFDGTHFINVPTRLNNTDFSITSMVTGNQGFIWMSTDLGLVRFNANTRKFKLFNLAAEQPFKLSTLTINKNINTEMLWIGSDLGVFKFDTTTLTSQLFLNQIASDSPDLRIFSIINTENDTTWIGTSQGLFYKTDQDSHFSYYDLSDFLSESQRISALLHTSDNNILVATPRNGLLKIDNHLQVSKAYSTEEWLYSMAEVSPGVIWLGTYGKGIIELAVNKQSVQQLRHNRLLNTSLINDEIWQIYIANNGLAWLATNDGLSLYNPKQTAIKNIYGDIGKHRGLTDVNVNSLVEDNQGRIWLGYREKGVDIISPTAKLIKHIGVDQKSPTTALPGGAVETIALHPSGESYIGTNWGIYQYGSSGLQQLQTQTRNTHSYTGALFLDQQHLWAGGTDGLWRFTLDNNQVTQTLAINTPENKLTDLRITTIGKALNNELLIGTWNGLNWLDHNGMITYQFPSKDQATNDHTEIGFVSSFFYDKNDRLWVATEGGGIYVAQDKNHPTSFAQITEKQGLSSNVVRAMQPDKFGRVWVSSITGIDVIDTSDLSITPLLVSEGALLAPYYRKAVIQTSTDEIIFGGKGGLTIIDPSKWQAVESFSPVVIINSTIGELQYTNPMMAQKNVQMLSIPANNNRVNIEFTTLDYINLSAIKYRYRLLGLSNEWTISNNEHPNATFTTLPVGDYQLEIQNSNAVGQWNSQTHQLHLKVLPFWYQTLLAKCIFVILLILFVILIIRYRTIRLQKHQLVLEAQVKQRTKSLELTTKALEEKTIALEKVSVTDPLTGINNRRFLDLNMPTEAAISYRRYHNLAPDVSSIEGADLTFFLIDIDHFKRVNDQYGHQAGDSILIEITHRLKALARESDYLVRWGGEEFLIVVRETSRDLADKFAQRICQQIKNTPFTINADTKLSLTCSVGFAPFPFCCHNPKALSWSDSINIADKALYIAKYASRDAWVGISLKTSYSTNNTSIDLLNLQLPMMNLISNIEQSKVNATWQELLPKT
ncbi:diguanylate cyclase [Thalassotalea piscium]